MFVYSALITCLSSAEKTTLLKRISELEQSQSVQTAPVTPVAPSSTEEQATMSTASSFFGGSSGEVFDSFSQQSSKPNQTIQSNQVEINL